MTVSSRMVALTPKKQYGSIVQAPEITTCDVTITWSAMRVW